MRGRRFFLLVAVGVNVMAVGFVACGGAEFTSTCEGDDCANGNDEAGARDGGADSDAGDVVDAGDAATGCDATASPADESCTIDEGHGVFVSPLGDDAEGRGDREAPFRTLAKGLSEAKASGKRLYACDDGTGYDETVVIDGTLDGLEAFGGFSCADWAYGAGKALLRPSVPGLPLRIEGLSEGLFLRDFTIQAPDAAEPGQSSIGVLVHASASVVFESVDIAAGEGKDGANGLEESEPALSGKDGNEGSKACQANPNPGAAAAVRLCGSNETSGGRGGDGGVGVNSAGNGNAGLPTSMPLGAEGIGQGSSACTAGEAGASGDAGESGAGASGTGTLDANGWIGVSGHPGTSGGIGQGGGGGGGAKAPLTCNLLATPTGASGGSGGAGGCGGQGGEGGLAGGSSIALVSIDSEVSLHECTLGATKAGRGGQGASGQKGGTGGSAGAGGSGSNGSDIACSGGKGGQGGDGGPGGGGAGGHSVGIAYVGTQPIRSGGEITVGEAGVGGDPGAGGPTSGRGADGRQAKELAF